MGIGRPPVERDLSLPPRGAWIEIEVPFLNPDDVQVAPPTGSVD